MEWHETCPYCKGTLVCEIVRPEKDEDEKE